MDAAIRIENLVKKYADVVAVNGLDLEVRRGECFGLLGPNGAGKTTTVEILEGLVPATSGTVELLGRTWDRDPDGLRERIGVALQETRLFDRLTVEETIRLFRSFYSKGALQVETLLAEMQLEEKRSTWVMKLSGGQRQRLAVALGLVGDPEVLFLDEPTTGLDPQSRRALWDTIAALRTRGKTVVLTTHYMDEAEHLCDRVAIVDRGKLIALGSPSELIDRIGGHHLVELATEPALPREALASVRGVRFGSRAGGHRRLRAVDRRAPRHVARAHRPPERARRSSHPARVAHRDAGRRFPLSHWPYPSRGLRSSWSFAR